MASTARDSRLEFRLASDEKEIFERAADLSGSNTTDFVRSTMLAAAKEAVRMHEVISFWRKGAAFSSRRSSILRSRTSTCAPWHESLEWSWSADLWRNASRRVASFAIIADAKDEDAQSYYEHYGFQILPTERHDRRLFLPMGTVEQLFTG